MILWSLCRVQCCFAPSLRLIQNIFAIVESLINQAEYSTYPSTPAKYCIVGYWKFLLFRLVSCLRIIPECFMAFNVAISTDEVPWECPDSLRSYHWTGWKVAIWEDFLWEQPSGLDMSSNFHNQQRIVFMKETRIAAKLQSAPSLKNSALLLPYFCCFHFHFHYQLPLSSNRYDHSHSVSTKYKINNTPLLYLLRISATIWSTVLPHLASHFLS